ncbi:MAG: hypothetical protein BA863_01780 [Desulfovibrio sp. S3730MH75]|nr:MAG: hypothetical protein BA863_01780 [Desulfovibrio sp. S3730MH75]
MNINEIEAAIENGSIGDDCLGKRLYLAVNAEMVDYLVCTHHAMSEALEKAEDTVAALMELAEKTALSVAMLQERLEEGATIEFQDKDWCLFADDGNDICSGTTISKMLDNLLHVIC